MKFENKEIEQMYYDLLKKYKIDHINLGYVEKTITYDDLMEIEEDLKILSEEWK